MATSRRAARPAAAPQTFTLSPKEHHSLFTDADITIFGGSKLRRAVLRPVHAAAPSSAARAAQMRRDALHGAKPPSSPQTNGMVDARRKMYEPLGGTYVASPRKRWTFPNCATINLSFIGERGRWDGLEPRSSGSTRSSRSRGPTLTA